MSVRMALAKLCACTCGGALIGTGAVQLSQPSVARERVSNVRSVPKMRSRVVHRARPHRVTRARSIQRVRRVVTRRTIIPAQPTVITTTGAPVPLPRPSGEYGGGSSGGYPIVIGGSGGFGGGFGGFFGGFFRCTGLRIAYLSESMGLGVEISNHGAR